MKFKVETVPPVVEEILQLEKEQQKALREDYKKIEENGIEFVYIKAIGHKLFEIKTGSIRSIFVYKDKKIVLVCVVFLKKTNKTPTDKIKLAIKRSKEH